MDYAYKCVKSYTFIGYYDIFTINSHKNWLFIDILRVISPQLIKAGIAIGFCLIF